MDINTSVSLAKLSEASYADFRSAEQPDGSYRSSDVQVALINIGGVDDDDKGFSLTQAEDFVTHWRVAHHQPNTPTGISATIFESLDNPGEFVFAMRGTEATAQWGTDITLADIADIGADGIALHQAIDLMNYYQRLTTPVEELAYQYELYEDTEPPPEGVEYIEYEDGIPFTGTHYRYLVPADPMQGLDIIPDSAATIDVTGHSLGGHLALIMSRLDPGRVGEVYTYNAPGFDTGMIGSDDTEWFFRAMGEIETNETGRTTVGNFPVTRIDNLVAPGDVVSEIGMIPGNITPHFSEGSGPASAHSISNATDALAIYNLLSAIDPNADLSNLTPILDAASNRGNETLESIIHSLSDLLINPIDVPIGEREPLYRAIHALEAELFVDRTAAHPQLKPAYQNLEVESLANLTQEQIIANANSDIAYRYALTHLNPFAIVGRESLYDDHNQNDALELYDPVTQTGELTTAYLQDRTHYLRASMQRNEWDVQHLTAASGDGELYWDAEAGQFMSEPAVGTTFGVDTDNLVHYRFGGDGDERNGELAGGTKDDLIYGGGGDDILNGNAGDDYLEGNAGIDHLLGGDGNDELRGGSGDDARIHNSGLFGGIGDDALYGEAGHDTLDGGADRDLLVGGLGQDHLIGGGGIDNLFGDHRYYDEAANQYVLVDDGESDRLEGGTGDDLYYAGAGDVINDSDGLGTVCMNVTTGSGEQVYIKLGLGATYQIGSSNSYEEYNDFYDATIRYTLNGATLTVSDTGNINNSITIENFSDTALGINIGPDYNPPLWLKPQHISYWFDLYRRMEYTDTYNVWWPTGVSLFDDAIRMVPRYIPISWETSLAGELSVVQGTDRDEPITGNEQSDRIHGGRGEDILSGNAGEDWLEGGEGNDELDGGDGDDWLFGGDGDDNLDGGDGTDRLFGGDGDDVLRGGEGDTLKGDAGNDRYLYARGDGNILITNYDRDPESQDTLQFLEGIDPSEVTISRLDDSLCLTIQGSGEVITVSSFFNFFEDGLGLDGIEFADGTRWDRTTIQDWIDQTGNGDDELTGTDEADLLEGHAGDDRLQGGAGDDTLTGGDGDDSVHGDGGNDVLTGDEGNDRLYGGDGNDRLDGGEGYDHLWGGAGDDHLISGEGGGQWDQQLFGGDGNDILECRGGFCSGGAGDDTYIHTAGQGYVWISNADPDSGGFDELLLRGIASTDVLLRRGDIDGNNLRMLHWGVLGIFPPKKT